LTQNVGKTFLKYVSMNIVGMIAASAMVFIDAIFISIALGAYGLAAVSLIGPVFGIVFGLGLLLGEGGGSKYAANMASQRHEKANAFFTVAVRSCFIISIPLILAGVFFPDQLSALLGAQGYLLPMVSGYVKIFLIFSPVIILYYALESFVRNDETPGAAMVSAVILYTMNILFDHIFILHLNLGMFGAGLATSLAATVALVYLLFHWHKKARFRFTKVFVAIKKSRAIFAIGAPSFIMNTLGGINMLVFNWLFLVHLGNIGVAAFGIVSTLSVVIHAIFLGISQGMQPMVSYYYGNSDTKNMNKVLKLSIITSLCIAFIFVILSFAFSQQLIAIFNQEQDIILGAQLTSLATFGMRIYFSAFIFVGITLISTYFLAATGAPKRALTLSLLQNAGIIPIVIVLSYIGGVLGIWGSYPAFELPLAILSIIFLIQKNTPE